MGWWPVGRGVWGNERKGEGKKRGNGAGVKKHKIDRELRTV